MWGKVNFSSAEAQNGNTRSLLNLSADTSYDQYGESLVWHSQRSSCLVSILIGLKVCTITADHKPFPFKDSLWGAVCKTKLVEVSIHPSSPFHLSLSTVGTKDETRTPQDTRSRSGNQTHTLANTAPAGLRKAGMRRRNGNSRGACRACNVDRLLGGGDARLLGILVP